MSQRTVYLSGRLVPESEARISIFDCALMYGDMAFEMTRTYAGRPFKLREHLVRLYASLRLMEIDCGLSIDQMEQATLQTLERNRSTEPADMDWQIMHNVSRGPLPLYRTAFAEPVGPTISINCWPLITHMGGIAPKYDSGVDLVIPAQQTLPAHLVDPRAKTRSRLHYQMANLQAARMGAGRWPVLLDPDGFLAEGTGCNVFLVREGCLLTPEPRNILLGVSRDVTMELAGKLDIPIRQANLGRRDALLADEIFCTATSYALVHAVSFEGQTVGNGGRGPVFTRLLQAWKNLTGVDFIAQAHDYARRLPAWEKEQLTR